MDQSAANVAEKTQKPENDENHKYGPQHKFILFRLIALGDLFIKCMFAPERFTGSQFPFGALLLICRVSVGAGPEVPHPSLRQT